MGLESMEMGGKRLELVLAGTCVVKCRLAGEDFCATWEGRCVNVFMALCFVAPEDGGGTKAHYGCAGLLREEEKSGLAQFSQRSSIHHAPKSISGDGKMCNPKSRFQQEDRIGVDVVRRC